MPNEYIMAVRVEELPNPRVESVQFKCITCKEKVWVAQKVIDDFDEDLPPIICQNCVTLAFGKRPGEGAAM